MGLLGSEGPEPLAAAIILTWEDLLPGVLGPEMIHQLISAPSLGEVLAAEDRTLLEDLLAQGRSVDTDHVRHDGGSVGEVEAGHTRVATGAVAAPDIVHSSGPRLHLLQHLGLQWRQGNGLAGLRLLP